jgi:type II secretory pathway component PulJ
MDGAGIRRSPATDPRTRHKISNSAFTLLEIVISSAIMALILISAYACFHAAISSRKLIEPRLEVLQNARVAMALISADLRAACPLSSDLDFLGMHRDLGGVEADNLDFGTHNYTPRRLNEGDFCQVSYYLNREPESGQYVLMRRRNPRLSPDPLSGGSREEIARGLAGLRFEYYDGLDWYDSWGDVEGHGKAETSNRLRSNLSGLPDAVRITLWFDSNPKPLNSTQTDQTNNAPPLVFQTVARLNLAAASEKAGSGSSSSGNNSDNSNQPQAAQPNPGGNQ